MLPRDDIKAVGLAAVEAALEGKDVKKVVVVARPPGEHRREVEDGGAPAGARVVT